MLLPIYKINYFLFILVSKFSKFFRILDKWSVFEFLYQGRVIWWIFVTSISAVKLKRISPVRNTNVIGTSSMRIVSRRVHVRIEIYAGIVQIDTCIDSKDTHIWCRWIWITGLVIMVGVGINASWKILSLPLLNQYMLCCGSANSKGKFTWIHLSKLKINVEVINELSQTAFLYIK